MYSNVFITCQRFSEKYKIIDKLDEGSTANVFKIKNKNTKETFALKAYNHRNCHSK
jgi:serine/threonine protein kinase